jgi:carbamoyltransferase|tara:strand:+ start:64 stop:1599 length:1536 start_codon:yes stop_codon:yes gene_type:complete
MCLIEDGDIKLHLDDERVSGIKRNTECFTALDCIKDDLDYVCVSGFSPNPDYNHNYKDYLIKKGKNFKYYNVWSKHHLFHASGSFYNSGFKKALCIIIDGMGSEYYLNEKPFYKGTYGREQRSSFIAEYPYQFKEIHKDVLVNFPYEDKHGHVNVSNHISEALMFELTCLKLGFNVLDAGKVMSLAAYGKKKNLHLIGNKKLYDVSDLRKIKFNNEVKVDNDFCFELQKQSQESVLNYIKSMIKKTGIKKVCLSGGYFLNCVANNYIKENLDAEIYIEPLANDSGQSLGIAKYFWHSLTKDKTIRKQKSIYYGINRGYQKEEIENKLGMYNLKKSNIKEIAYLIKNHNLVGVFGNRSESGPRALGNRSLLYNPTDPSGQDKVNEVKKRESFRPFACSILEDKLNEYFSTDIKKSPYMMYAIKSISDKIPAVLHVDNTCRLQTVSENDNKYFYDLIKSFEKLTNIPLVLNTSFNLAGKPIVETLDDIKFTLENSKLEYVYFYDSQMLVSKIF